MEDKEFKHFFDAGLAWARKAFMRGETKEAIRRVVVQDVRKWHEAEPFAAGALYGIMEVEADSDRQQAR